MRCEACKGTGQFPTINTDGQYGPLYPRTLPCPDCDGTGIAYCCEGSERHGQLSDEDTTT